jgi:hypothetical protein
MPAMRVMLVALSVSALLPDVVAGLRRKAVGLAAQPIRPDTEQLTSLVSRRAIGSTQPPDP